MKITVETHLCSSNLEMPPPVRDGGMFYKSSRCKGSKNYIEKLTGKKYGAEIRDSAEGKEKLAKNYQKNCHGTFHEVTVIRGCPGGSKKVEKKSVHHVPDHQVV